MEVIDRLRAKTPKFFVRLRNIALALSAACTSASLFYSQLPTEVTSTVPEGLIRNMAIVGIAAAFVSQLTRVDTPKP